MQELIMFGLSVIIVAFMSHFMCEASYVDTLPKCSVEDSDCLRDTYQKVIREIGKTGIPEVGIPPIDPMKLDGISIPVIDSVNLNIKEGVIKGIKNCNLIKFNINLEKEWGTQEIFCDVLTIKGEFTTSGDSPILESFVGNKTINGEGKAKVKLEKLKMNFEFPFSILKKEDGYTYMKVSYKKMKYTYELEKATFITEKILVGNQDISSLVSTYMNQNWKSAFESFGKVFMDKAMGVYSALIDQFLEKTPTNLFIKDDLTKYVKN